MTASRNQQMLRFLSMALVAIMVACSWLSPFDTTANAQVDAGLKRAAATYASARLLNGAISVVQGTQISAAPAGMGMTFAPGEILAITFTRNAAREILKDLRKGPRPD